MKRTVIWLFLLLVLGMTNATAQTMDLQELIDAANEGDTLHLEKGLYEGPITITKSLSLKGEEGTVLMANGKSAAITIEGTSHVTVQGIGIETAGTAITVRKSQDIELQAIQMKGVDAGVKVHHSNRVKVGNLSIEGNDKHYAQKGNGIAVYNSESVDLRGNTIQSVQDGFYIEQAKDVAIAENTVTESRYGTHFMYSEKGTVLGNSFSGNVTGLMIMMANQLQLEENDISYQEGFNGTGITLYEASGILLRANTMTGNRVGVSIQKTSDVKLDDNMFQMNQTALESVQSDGSNEAAYNRFVGNLVNVRSDAGGLRLMTNYYDDYTGIDLDGDGVGDESYTALQSFGQWMVRKPVYQYFTESPSVVLLNTIDKQTNMASKTLLVDEAPLTKIDSSRDIAVNLQPLYLLVGFVLLGACIVIYRRSIRI